MTDDELRAHYQAALSGRAEALRGSCPSPEALQSLADGTASESARLDVLDHVMSCPSCPRDLALLRALHAARPRQAVLLPRQWLAAAGLLLLLGGGAFLARGIMAPPLRELTRGGSVGGDQSVSVIAPLTIPAGRIQTLSWHAVPGATRYSVEVLNADGQVLFARQTTDTLTSVPVLSAPPAAWWVRATLGDGSERRSVMVQLQPGR